MKSVPARLNCLLILACLVFAQAACSGRSNRGAHNRPRSLEGRQWLLVRPAKRRLERKDIEALAHTYKVYDRNEKPALVDVLKPNKDCQPSPSTEELVLPEGEGGDAPGGAPCKKGMLLIPIF